MQRTAPEAATSNAPTLMTDLLEYRGIERNQERTEPQAAIEGGTSEVMLDVIAKRILGLPG